LIKKNKRKIGGRRVEAESTRYPCNFLWENRVARKARDETSEKSRKKERMLKEPQDSSRGRKKRERTDENRKSELFSHYIRRTRGGERKYSWKKKTKE